MEEDDITSITKAKAAFGLAINLLLLTGLGTLVSGWRIEFYRWIGIMQLSTGIMFLALRYLQSDQWALTAYAVVWIWAIGTSLFMIVRSPWDTDNK